MASVSERTFGARLQNAEKIATHLSAFTGYNPPAPEQSVVNYKKLIESIKTKNYEAAAQKQAYSAAVESRQQLFQKDSSSLNKIMTP